MNPILLTGSLLALFILLLVGCVIYMAPYKSPAASRSEKNGYHVATAIVTLFCISFAALPFVIPTVNHPILWISVGLWFLFMLPIRILTTELGIRRRTIGPAGLVVRFLTRNKAK